MDKRNWKKIEELKCPVVGCTTKGRKTKLEDHGIILSCPKCKGEWTLTNNAPMDISWVETKTPITETKWFDRKT